MGANEKRGWTALDRTVVARRSFLTGALGVFSLAVTSHPVLAAIAGLEERRIVLHRPQFGESFSGIYWQDGQYVPEALSEISHLFREPKNGAVREIDPALLDGLMALRRKLGSPDNFEIISGFRQPRAGENDAQAQRTSYHHVGRAVDVRLSGRTPQQIFDAARELRIGGVGRYAGKSFVHVDTGDVRTWAWGYGNRNVTMSTKAPAASPGSDAATTVQPGLRKPARGAAVATATPPSPLPRPR
jgi:uncharacterized protein YcbK (DUF882 family)